MTRMTAAAIAALVLAAYPAAGAEPLMQQNVSAEEALAIVNRAIDACRDSSISITVLDRDGEVRMQVRANGANPHNLELSYRKAYTARTFRMPSAEWAKRTAPGQDLNGQRTLPVVIPLGGGMPIRVKGDTIGAVGISGANGGQPREEACARQAIEGVMGPVS